MFYCFVLTNTTDVKVYSDVNSAFNIVDKFI